MIEFRKLSIILMIFLWFSASLNVAFYIRILEYKEDLSILQTKISELSLENLTLKESLEILRQSIHYYPVNSSPVGQWIYVTAVTTAETGYVGEVMRVYARFVEGSGKVFIATTPKIGIDLQASAETAFGVAQEISKINADKMDSMLTVVSNRTIDVVDGPSAGVAITVLLTSLLQGKEIRKDVIATGTIRSDGTIGQVGGIIEKAKAAASVGATTFLVPKGQSTTVIYVKRVTQEGRLRIITYEPVLVNVQEYLQEQGYNIKVIEVADIFEALNYFQA